MKKLFPLSLITAALAVTPALCQGTTKPPTPAGSAAQPQPRSQAYRINLLHMDRLLEQRLKITPEQKTKIQELANKAREAGPAFDPGLAGKDRVSQFLKAKEAEQKAQADAEALLTPEQKKALEQVRKDVELYPGLGRYGLALAYLGDVTDVQRNKFRQFSNLALQQRGQIVAAARQQGAKPNSAELAQKLRELDREILVSIRSVLTPEQQEAMGPRAPRRPTSKPTPQ